MGQRRRFRQRPRNFPISGNIASRRRRAHGDGVMRTSDRRYYRRRAEAELKAASTTENAEACRAHYQLAELYLDRVYPPAEAPPANDAEPAAND